MIDSGLECDGCGSPLYVHEVHDCPVLGTTVVVEPVPSPGTPPIPEVDPPNE